MGLESGSKKRNIEAGRFGYEGIGKETWEGFPSYFGSSRSSDKSTLRELKEMRKDAEKIRKLLEDLPLLDETDIQYSDMQDVDTKGENLLNKEEKFGSVSSIDNDDEIKLEIEKLKNNLSLIFGDGIETTNDTKSITLIDKNMSEQYAETLVNSMVNGELDTNGQPIIKSEDQEYNIRNRGFTALKMLTLVSFTFSGLILLIGTIIIASMK